MTDTALTDGHIVGIAGPVIDAEFPIGDLPQINTALEFDVVIDGNEVTIVAEVAQQIGDSRVRAIAMKPTDGLTRGTAVRNTGKGISVPVGDATLGHVFSVTGAGLDDPTAGEGAERWETKLYTEEKKRVKFKDVAGADEEKQLRQFASTCRKILIR